MRAALQVERTLEQLPACLTDLRLGGMHAVRVTVLRLDRLPALRRLSLAAGIYKDLALPTSLRKLTLGPDVLYAGLQGVHTRQRQLWRIALRPS